jgi:pilus assembly protein CpaF
LGDPEVTEIMINGPQDVRVEKAGTVAATTVQFSSSAALLAAVRNIAEYNGRELDDRHPTMDGRLPDGSRIHVILPPAARNGITVTIRRFQKASFQLASLIQLDSLTAEAAEFLDLSVQLHRNLVISGGTGSGKTSLLNALSACIPRHERVIVIEDTSELQLAPGGHTVCLEAQSSTEDGRSPLTIRDLFTNSLRMRPDRIIVGEVRRGEALDLIQSMISGHAGALTTVHANTPRDALLRLETLCLMSDTELPVYVARQQVASAVHLVVQTARFPDGSRRVSAISECCGLDRMDERGQYLWNDLFRFVGAGRDSAGRIKGSLQRTGNRPTWWTDVQTLGLTHRISESRELWKEPD